MKFIKMLGLAAIATAIAVAVIGAGSASAVTLCKANQNPECATANRYPVGQEIHAVLAPGTKATLEAGPITDECTTSLMKGKTTANNGATLLGTIEEVTFGGPGGENCTCPVQEAIGLPWQAHVSATGGGNGKMTVNNPGGLVNCEGLECEYETNEASVNITGGNPATVSANVELAVVGGNFLCFFGGNATWTAVYEILTPKPLFISEKP